MINMDNVLSLPVVGQFDPRIQEDKGQPIWQVKPGVAGAQPFIKYTGVNISTMSFEFLAIGTTVLDPYPLLAWMRLNELAANDEALGHPPRIAFAHGPMVAEGFITSLPEAPFEYWGGDNAIRSRIVRQIGPVRITITRLPKDPMEISLKTSYVPYTEDVEFEDVCKSQYGDARLCQTLAIYNQGVLLGSRLELPRRKSGLVSNVTPIAPYQGDPIPGL
jgi:hypothetical protein